MPLQKMKVNMPGVAEGKQLAGIPTDDDIPSEDRVKAFLGSWEEEDQVRNFHCTILLQTFPLLSFVVINRNFSSWRICSSFFFLYFC
jgi:hypothetical protein